MKAVVSVLGRFHAFDLARELARQNALEHLFTSYPKKRAAAFSIPPERVSGRIVNEALNRATQRVERWTRGVLDTRAIACAFHDDWVAKNLRSGADIFLGWSGAALASLERARSLGMLAFLERGSTHIEHQRDLLAAEYERWGLDGRLPDPRVVDRELKEYAKADRIVVPTRHVAQTFLDQGIEPERLIQVPYGVSLDAFRPPRNPNRRRKTFTLMHCGNVSLRKGCHYLIRAFTELKLPNARLVFVGPVAAEIRPLLERISGPGISFVGRVPQPELIRHYDTASAFCLASLEEGMAMVIPQAMASALPIIATRESGAEEIVRDGVDGRLIASRDIEDLQRAILDLYENEERREAMGESAAERVASGFSWRDYGERVHDAYVDALREPSTESRLAA